MKDLLDTALRAARAGAAVVEHSRRSRSFSVSLKSRADFVTEVDVAAEAAICAVIREAHPGHAILAEEGATGASPSEWTWVVDPLDGTTNFIRGIPFFGVAVAIEHHSAPVASVVIDPVRDEVYSALRGAGAWLGDARLSVSGEADVASALVLTGIPFRNVEFLPRYMPGLERVARATSGIRRMGSAALDLCAVAAGRAEAFWEFGLSRWDVSAGALIVEEAGGRVTDLIGATSHLESGDILASNAHVHDAMLALIGA